MNVYLFQLPVGNIDVQLLSEVDLKFETRNLESRVKVRANWEIAESVLLGKG